MIKAEAGKSRKAETQKAEKQNRRKVKERGNRNQKKMPRTEKTNSQKNHHPLYTHYNISNYVTLHYIVCYCVF